MTRLACVLFVGALLATVDRAALAKRALDRALFQGRWRVSGRPDPRSPATRRATMVRLIPVFGAWAVHPDDEGLLRHRE